MRRTDFDISLHTGEIIARHVSPDGKLIWRVERDEEANGKIEYSAGFEGFLWHVHPDQLKRKGDPLAKLLSATEDLLADRLIIVEETWPVPDSPGEVGLKFWLLVDLELDLETKDNIADWKLRFWSGRTVDIDALIDGKIDYLPFDQKYFTDEFEARQG